MEQWNHGENCLPKSRIEKLTWDKLGQGSVFVKAFEGNISADGPKGNKWTSVFLYRLYYSCITDTFPSNYSTGYFEGCIRTVNTL
jgi:hypothetical protein